MLATPYRYAPKVTILLLFRMAQQGAVTQRTARPLGGASRLKIRSLCLLFLANGFEGAMLRWPLSNGWGEFYFPGDQIRCFEFSVEHQTPSVPSDVAKHKFDWSRERNRVAFTPAPLCLRRLGRPPRIQPRVQHEETAFSVALRFKSHGAGSLIPEHNLDIPLAYHTGRLCLAQRHPA